MNNEWRDLPTMADVAAAQAAGDEIEVHHIGGVWNPWKGVSWANDWVFRARPAQPKMKKVKILGWVNKMTGGTDTKFDGTTWSDNWIRYPELDDEIEVPCED